MIRALLLIFDPIRTWEKIARAQRGLGFVLGTSLLPLLLLSSLAEGYGLVRWGKWQSEVSRLKTYNPGEALIFEILQVLLVLLVIFLSARMIRSFGETFHGRHTFLQAFTAVAYGLGPFFLLHFLDAFSQVSPWFTFAVGMILSIGTLYHGLPRVMMPDPPHAFGLFLMGTILVALALGLVRFVTFWYFAGRFTELEFFISRMGARLHL